MLLTTLAFTALGSVAPPALPASAAPGPPAPESLVSPEPPESIGWFSGSHAEAIGSARDEGKWLLTYFWANTENCSKLYNQTMGDSGVVGALSQMVCFSANAGEEGGRALLDDHRLTTVPALLITGPDGVAEEMLLGFIPPDALLAELARVKRGENTVGQLRSQVLAKHESLEDELNLRRQLSWKLDAVGSWREADAERLTIRERDPKGSTQVGADVHLDHVIAGLQEKYGDDVSAWKLSEIEKLARRVTHPVGKYVCQLTVGSYEYEAERYSDAIDAYREAWRLAPMDRPEELTSSFGIVERMVPVGEELNQKERLFLLEVSLGLVEIVRTLEARKEAENPEADGSGEYALYYVAQCQLLTGSRDLAISTMETVLAKHPTNEDYVRFMDKLRGAENA